MGSRVGRCHFFGCHSMIHFVLLISRQGKVRLTKWYSPYTQKERTKNNSSTSDALNVQNLGNCAVGTGDLKYFSAWDMVQSRS
ncbi:hypothetical protein K1719_022791 [Acacia pycnantha]|nr:hypothetical protein K1719_022791 [Acacia pycnantha]